MANLTYHEQKDIENIKRLRQLIKELPPFCADFFRGIEPRTSTRTRIAYAYDLRIFFDFLKNNNSAVASMGDKIPLSVLEQLTVTDLEEYLEYLKCHPSVIGEDVIIATNSSYMVSSLFADCVKNPSRLCNMHFYNPALVMEFVEVVQGPHTSEETAGAIFDLAKRMGKDPIWQKKEIPGFAGNYLIAGLTQRARYLVQNGYCTPQEVDIALEKGFNHKMGVFRMGDLTGIDLTYTMMKSTYERTGEKPDMFDVYEQMVKEGRLGRKTGHGFYDYE